SGMGKTALCKRFLAGARKQGALVFSGRCYENESRPTKAVDPIVDEIGDFLKKLRDADAAAFLPRERRLQALAHAFRTLLRVEPICRTQREFGDEASRPDLRTHAISGLKELLARIAEKRTCIVHIDDFQWGDLDSVDWLTEILAPPDPPRILFLFSYRSE